MDENNTTIRSALVETLVKQARVQLDHDWTAADKLAREAARLEPANPMARSLLALLEDRRRAEYVESCVVEARQLQAVSNIDDAMTAVTRGLASYPEDQRLLQLRGTLEQTRTAMVKPPQPDPITFRPATGPALPKAPPPKFDDAETVLAAAPQSVRTVMPPPAPIPQPTITPPAAAPLSAKPTEQPPQPAPAGKKPNIALYAGAGVVAALVMALLAYKFFGGPEEPPVTPPPVVSEAPPTTAPETPLRATGAEAKPPAVEPPPVVTAAKGAVLVTITEPGFTLLLDGRPVTGLRPAGPNQYLLGGLSLGRRKLAVQKAGFRADPESAFVPVLENQTARVTLKLVADGPGRWSLQGARPGTQVFLASGRLLATADAQGNAGGSDLPEGWQELELQI